MSLDDYDQMVKDQKVQFMRDGYDISMMEEQS
jgi:hypothetical protein